MQEVLTPYQEAWLDAGPICHPWTVNFWSLSEALAAQHALPAVRARHSLAACSALAKRYTLLKRCVRVLVTMSAACVPVLVAWDVLTTGACVCNRAASVGGCFDWL